MPPSNPPPHEDPISCCCCWRCGSSDGGWRSLTVVVCVVEAHIKLQMLDRCRRRAQLLRRQRREGTRDEELLARTLQLSGDGGRGDRLPGTCRSALAAEYTEKLQLHLWISDMYTDMLSVQAITSGSVLCMSAPKWMAHQSKKAKNHCRRRRLRSIN